MKVLGFPWKISFFLKSLSDYERKLLLKFIKFLALTSKDFQKRFSMLI